MFPRSQNFSAFNFNLHPLFVFKKTVQMLNCVCNKSYVYFQPITFQFPKNWLKHSFVGGDFCQKCSIMVQGIIISNLFTKKTYTQRKMGRLSAAAYPVFTYVFNISSVIKFSRWCLGLMVCQRKKNWKIPLMNDSSSKSAKIVLSKSIFDG